MLAIDPVNSVEGKAVLDSAVDKFRECLETLTLPGKASNQKSLISIPYFDGIYSTLTDPSLSIPEKVVPILIFEKQYKDCKNSVKALREIFDEADLRNLEILSKHAQIVVENVYVAKVIDELRTLVKKIDELNTKYKQKQAAIMEKIKEAKAAALTIIPAITIAEGDLTVSKSELTGLESKTTEELQRKISRFEALLRNGQAEVEQLEKSEKILEDAINKAKLNPLIPRSPKKTEKTEVVSAVIETIPMAQPLDNSTADLNRLFSVETTTQPVILNASPESEPKPINTQQEEQNEQQQIDSKAKELAELQQKLKDIKQEKLKEIEVAEEKINSQIQQLETLQQKYSHVKQIMVALQQARTAQTTLQQLKETVSDLPISNVEVLKTAIERLNAISLDVVNINLLEQRVEALQQCDQTLRVNANYTNNKKQFEEAKQNIGTLIETHKVDIENIPTLKTNIQKQLANAILHAFQMEIEIKTNVTIALNQDHSADKCKEEIFKKISTNKKRSLWEQIVCNVLPNFITERSRRLKLIKGNVANREEQLTKFEKQIKQLVPDQTVGSSQTLDKYHLSAEYPDWKKLKDIEEIERLKRTIEEGEPNLKKSEEDAFAQIDRKNGSGCYGGNPFILLPEPKSNLDSSPETTSNKCSETRLSPRKWGT